MRVQYMSDLHLEFGHLYLPEKAADVLVLAGDIFTAHGFVNTDSKKNRYRKFLDYVSKTYKHVIYVGGNHELYGWKNTKKSYLAAIRRELPANVHLLDNEAIMLDGVRFVGGTLWTNFGGTQYYQDLAQHGMNDFRVFSTDDALRWHHETVYFLDTLEPYDRTVVVTHHAPSFLSVHPKYAGDKLNTAYASNLEHLMTAPVWLHGHMHDNSDYTVGNTRVLCNPRGYPKGDHSENAHFNPTATFEV
jgi:Icc-related predicted phosphoesterase